MTTLEELLESAKKTSDLRASLEPHRENLIRYLNALYGGAERDSARVFVGPKAGSAPAPEHLPLSVGYAAIATAVLDMAVKTDTYVAIAPNRADANVCGARHGTVSEKASIGTLHADFDVGDESKTRSSEPGHAPFFTSWKDVVRLLVPLPLQPSMLVMSGSGVHAYWLFDRHTSDLTVVQALNTSLQNDLRARARALPEPRYGCDFIPSPAQLLRPPGSINYKRGEKKIVELLHLSDKRYSLDELRAVWPAGVGAKKVFAPILPLDRELSRGETLSVMRGSVLRAHGWEHQQAALKFLAGESWAPPGSQDIVLTRIAWRLSMACRWRPSTEAVEDLCDAAADAVENTGEPWTSDQIFQRFDSAIARGLAAAEKDAALLRFLKQHNRPN